MDFMKKLAIKKNRKWFELNVSKFSTSDKIFIE